MYSFKEMPSASSMFSTYASMTASIMLFRSMANDIVPRPIRGYLLSTLGYFFKTRSTKLTLVIEDRNGMGRNHVYDASEIYLCTKISPDANRLKVIKNLKDKNLTIRFEKGERIDDSFEGIDLKWRFVYAETEKSTSNNQYSRTEEQRYFELSFDKKHKEKVLYSYLPFVLNRAKTVKDEERVVKLCTLSNGHSGSMWDSINLEHPSTFDTLALDPDLKKAIIEDLDRFVKRKEFYKKVGRAWKRGYLLYGPPGTGKSSLIAAMANYLKFDIYDLQLGNLIRDSDLRRLLLATANRSILVIEDIDCSVDLPDRRQGDGRRQPDIQSRKGNRNRGVVWPPADSSSPTGNVSPLQLSLSGLLNFIDGLWSSCGDERIIIFTTNHKDRLDPALLRPGRMDMHIHMSYCTTPGFKLLASNYLGISGYHRLFGEIEGLLENAEVTPAQVAEELMKSDDAEVALGGLVKLLKRKAIEGDELIDKAAKKVGFLEAKRQKIENKMKPTVRNMKSRRSTRRRNL